MTNSACCEVGSGCEGDLKPKLEEEPKGGGGKAEERHTGGGLEPCTRVLTCPAEEASLQLGGGGLSDELLLLGFVERDSEGVLLGGVLDGSQSRA